MMFDFQINRGLSTDLFINGQVNPDLIIEEGCWYLCTDTAELYVGVNTEEGLTLKQVNDAEAHPIVAEVKAKVETVILPKVEAVDNVIDTVAELQTWVEQKEYLQDIDLDGYATEDFVTNAINGINIPETELYKVDFNAPDYAAAIEAYKNGKVLVLVNAAPDINSYAVMNYVSDKYITFTKFLMSRSETYGAFNTYYLSTDNTWEVSQEVRLNKVEANVDGEVKGELDTIRIGKEIYSIPSTEGLASTEYVDKAIAGIEIPEHEKVDLTGYATEEWVENKKYLTEHQDLSNYAKKSDLPDVSGFTTKDELTAAIEGIEHPTINLDNYVTKDELDGFISEIPENYVTEEELASKGYITDVSDKADKNHTHDEYLTELPAHTHEEYLTELPEHSHDEYLTEHQDISGKADKNHTHSMSEITDYVAPEIPSLDAYATKQEVTDALAVKVNEVLFTTAKFVTRPAGNFIANENISGLTIAELFAKLLGLSDEPGSTPDEPDYPENPQTPEEILEYLTKKNASIYIYDDTDTLVQAPFTEPTAWTTSEASVRMDGVSTKYTIKDGDAIVEAGYQQATTYSDTYWLTVALPSEINNIKVKLYDPDVPGWIEQNWHMVPAAEQTIDGYTIWTVPEEFEIDAGATYRFVIIN